MHPQSTAGIFQNWAGGLIGEMFQIQLENMSLHIGGENRSSNLHLLLRVLKLRDPEHLF